VANQMRASLRLASTDPRTIGNSVSACHGYYADKVKPRRAVIVGPKRISWFFLGIIRHSA
jgi:hypothetical protein